METKINQLTELYEFLNYAKIREKRYIESLSNFIKINSEKNIIRTQKNIFFNKVVQFRIRKKMRNLLKNMYELLND